jgi:sugar phosphate isomerase/epimerase
LHEYDVKLGLDHPEKTPAEVLEKRGCPDDRLGVPLDTSWFGTYGFDAARAVAELADVLVHVHLKDVRAAGAHETCRFGEGVVPLGACRGRT